MSATWCSDLQRCSTTFLVIAQNKVLTAFMRIICRAVTRSIWNPTAKRNKFDYNFDTGELNAITERLWYYAAAKKLRYLDYKQFYSIINLFFFL